MAGVDPIFFIALNDDELAPKVRAKQPGQRSIEQVLSEFRGGGVEGRVSIRLDDVTAGFCLVPCSSIEGGKGACPNKR